MPNTSPGSECASLRINHLNRLPFFWHADYIRLYDAQSALPQRDGIFVNNKMLHIIGLEHFPEHPGG